MIDSEFADRNADGDDARDENPTAECQGHDAPQDALREPRLAPAARFGLRAAALAGVIALAGVPTAGLAVSALDIGEHTTCCGNPSAVVRLVP